MAEHAGGLPFRHFRAPCALLELDSQWAIVECSQELETWTGVPRPELLGRRLADLLPAGGRIFLETHCRPLLASGAPVNEVALDVLGPEGARVPVLLSARAVPGDDPRDVRVHAVLVGVSQRATYERELRRMRDDARLAGRRSELLRAVTEAVASASDPLEIATAALPLIRAGAGAARALFVTVLPGCPPVLVHGVPAAEPVSEATLRAVLDAAAGHAPSPFGAVLALRCNGTLLGAVALDAPEPPEGMGDVLARCAAQCAQALDRALLFAELSRSSHRHALVAELGASALALGSVHALVERATGALADALPADTVQFSPAPPAEPAPEAGGSAFAVDIGPPERRFGVLTARRTAGRPFGVADEHLVHAVAGILWAAVERERASVEAERRTTHDSLTGLPNRVLLLRRLEHALGATAHATGRPAVFCLDLDHLKLINDTLGHDAGDEVLHATASRLLAAVRPGDTVARMGGDVFMVLCPGVQGRREADRLAERLAAAVAAPLRVGGRDRWVQASIGMALASTPTSATELLSDADAAMNRAKERGRGRHEVFDDSLRERAVARLTVEADLRLALQRDELRVFYQPLVRMSDGSVRGFEALVRWQHPTRGLLAPGAFVPTAEETDIIADLGRFVLERACRDIGARREALERAGALHVTVNVAARQLLAGDFEATVADALALGGLADCAGALGLEITEGLLVDPRDEAGRVLAAVKRLGVQVLIDDFGTGFSSLSRLRHFPIDTLKIDRSFVSGVCDAGPDAAIIRAVIALADALGLDVVAEGVETGDQRRELARLGCSSAQGYLFGRPAPIDERGALPLLAVDAETHAGAR